MANGWCVWNMLHKLTWIYCFVASLCYLFTYLIWLIICHIDIITNEDLHSESFAGMKFKIYQGPAMYLTLILFITMCGSSVLYRIHFWRMKTRDIKYMYQESESSSQIVKSAEIDFLLNPESE